MDIEQRNNNNNKFIIILINVYSRASYREHTVSRLGKSVISQNKHVQKQFLWIVLIKLNLYVLSSRYSFETRRNVAFFQHRFFGDS
jgi:hypothetical protein